tara:strand:- start:1111 stop:1473 length:363 start_codon:yes stop_codon:yes gene_type:complete
LVKNVKKLAKDVDSSQNAPPFDSMSTGKSKSSRITRDLVVQNKLGLHARPASMFVKLATKFESEIFVIKDGEEVNGKSIMGLMMLAAGQGTALTICAEGNDAQQAIDELEQLLNTNFEEE